MLVELEPDRIIDRDVAGSVSPEQTLSTLVDKGLRARLQTGSLLTGQLFVELNLYPGTPINLVADADVPYPELPTIVGALEAISQSITAFISKLEEIDIDAMGDNIVGILEGTNDLVNKPQSEQTVTDLQASIRSFRKILDNVEQTELDATVASAHRVLGNLNKTLNMVNEVLEPNAPLQYNVIKVTDELEETARAIRSLVETLERRPQALIFGPRQPGRRRIREVRLVLALLSVLVIGIADGIVRAVGGTSIHYYLIDPQDQQTLVGRIVPSPLKLLIYRFPSISNDFRLRPDLVRISSSFRTFINGARTFAKTSLEHWG